MKAAAKVLVLALGLIGLMSGTTQAGTISISLTPRARVADETLTVHLKIRNGGDEAARSVSPQLGFLGDTVRADARERLEPNGTWEAVLALPAKDRKPGRWPFWVMVDYADANEYPFHALHVGTVTVGAPPPAKVAVLGVSVPPLAARGSLEARLKNLSATPKSVSVTVHLPEGVEVEAAPPPIDLDGWEEKVVTAALVNHTGLPGSRYAIFLSAEYDESDTHQAVVVPSTVEIVAPQSVFERWRPFLWAGAGLLVLVWLLAVGWRLVGRRPARSRR